MLHNVVSSSVNCTIHILCLGSTNFSYLFLFCKLSWTTCSKFGRWRFCFQILQVAKLCLWWIITIVVVIIHLTTKKNGLNSGSDGLWIQEFLCHLFKSYHILLLASFIFHYFIIQLDIEVWYGTSWQRKPQTVFYLININCRRLLECLPNMTNVNGKLVYT